jgi:predicted outer membrane repeat protein
VDDAGGAIYLKYSSFEGKNIDFINCSATFGAAITSLKSTFSLNNGYFENNSAKWNGGAIYHMYDDFTMTSSKFINNSARNGGAVFIDNCTSLYLRANIFTANSASFVGGAVYSLLNIVKVPILGFNKFSDNQAYLSENLFDSSNINLTIGSGNYSMVKFNDSPIDAIPSRYSLYENGFTTVVKDQQTSGNCWAFTAISVLESCILKATGNTYDLSEENMKIWPLYFQIMDGI